MATHFTIDEIFFTGEKGLWRKEDDVNPGVTRCLLKGARESWNQE